MDGKGMELNFNKKERMTGSIYIKDKEKDIEFLRSLGIRFGVFHEFKKLFPGENQPIGVLEGIELDTEIYKELEKHKDKFLYDIKTDRNWEAFKKHRTRK